MDFITKDSGEREEFSTGAKRDVRTGKGRYDLIPAIALERVAKLYERGAVKYGAWNWSKGMNMARYADSLLRHMFQYLQGYRDEDHLAAVVFNATAMIHTEDMIKRGKLSAELNDIPKFVDDEDVPDYYKTLVKKED